LAKLFYAHQFVLELVKLFADGLQHSNALTVTLAGYNLYVFRVDTVLPLSTKAGRLVYVLFYIFNKKKFYFLEKIT